MKSITIIKHGNGKIEFLLRGDTMTTDEAIGLVDFASLKFRYDQVKLWAQERSIKSKPEPATTAEMPIAAGIGSHTEAGPAAAALTTAEMPEPAGSKRAQTTD